jgi:aspartate aminotransferase
MRQAGKDVIGFGAGRARLRDTGAHSRGCDRSMLGSGESPLHADSGLPELREAIAKKTARDSGFEISASQVLVTNGAKQAVFQTFATLCDPGDEVLIPAPYWTTYPEAVNLAGGVPVSVATDSRFHMDVEYLEAALTPATKILLFVSPSNPTGAVATRDEVEAIGKWALDRGLWVVTDEIYEHLVYGDNRFSSIATLTPELRAVRRDQRGSQDVRDDRVARRVDDRAAGRDRGGHNLQSQTTSNVSNVSQSAALAAVSGDLSAVAEMRAVFDRRRRTIHKMLNECKG